MTRERLQPIVIFGAGGHASVVLDAVRRTGRLDVRGVLTLPGNDKSSRPKHNETMGLPILGDERDETLMTDLVAQGVGGVVAVGEIARRMKIVETIARVAPDFRFVEVVHPGAIIADNVQLGAGCMVLAGAVINTNTVIGAHAIVNTSASVDHDNHIGDFGTLAPGVTTGGAVSIGARTMVGLGASIIDHITVGQGCLLGAGSTVVRDIPDGVVAYGNPARVIRPNTLR